MIRVVIIHDIHSWKLCISIKFEKVGLCYAELHFRLASPSCEEKTLDVVRIEKCLMV